LLDWFHGADRNDVIVTPIPSGRLAETLFADEADAALLPVVEHFRGYGGTPVPGIGVATRGATGSVKLFSRVAPAAIRRVSVDPQSRTSVALLRILLIELWNIRPDFFVNKNQNEDLFAATDASLVVGDGCFAVENRLSATDMESIRVLDLGDLWTRLTDLPFVFSLWSLGRHFITRANEAQQASLTRLLTRARDFGLANLTGLAEREAARGRPGPGGRANPEVLRRYFETTLHYAIGEKEIAGLHRFYDFCVKHAICPAGHAPQLAAAGTG